MKLRGGTVIKALLVLAAAVVAFNMLRLSQRQLVTQTAKPGSYTNSVDTEGFIVRDETVLASSVTGILEPEQEEGDKVSAYSLLGSVVTGDVDVEMTKELEELNERIESIKSSMSEMGILSIDDSRIDSVLELSLSNFTYAAAKGNAESAASVSSDIKILSARKAGLTSSSAAQQNLDELTARRDALAASLGGVRAELYAPRAGVFSKDVDGLEDVLTPASLAGITPSKIESFESLLEGAYPSGLCKVVNNYAWYVAAVLPESDTDALSAQKSYSVVFKNNSEASVPGTLTYISEPDEDGNCALVFKFDRYMEGFESLRKVEITVIKEQFSGIYIPSQAVRVADGITGVYVRNTKSTDFRSIDIAYKNDDFVLAKTDADGKEPYSNILLYDNILVNPDD